MTINLRKITQGERGTLTFTWEFPENLTSPASISGAAITATMTDEDGVTTAVSGTLTGTAATTCTWALSAGDSGTAGTFTVLFAAIVTGVTTYTLEATLEVIANPSATAAQNEPLVGVPTTDAAWVTLAATAVPDGGDVVDANDLGTAAYAATGDFDAAGAAATAVSNHEIAYDHANIPSVDEASALTAYQSALAAAGAGQVLTASGPGTAAFAAAGLAYLCYVATITQSGTSAPTATVLENTLGGEIVWARAATGRYTGTLTNAFPSSTKTVVMIGDPYPSSTEFFAHIQRSNASVITVRTAMLIDPATLLDGVLLTPVPVEIRVYP